MVQGLWKVVGSAQQDRPIGGKPGEGGGKRLTSELPQRRSHQCKMLQIKDMLDRKASIFSHKIMLDEFAQSV